MFENNPFENKAYHGIYYSRFVASWLKAGGTFERHGWKFKKWLEQLIIDGKNIPADRVSGICRYAIYGKLELESNAKLFLKNNSQYVENLKVTEDVTTE